MRKSIVALLVVLSAVMVCVCGCAKSDDAPASNNSPAGDATPSAGGGPKGGGAAAGAPAAGRPSAGPAPLPYKGG